jgi:outer membrane protein W
LISEYTYDVGYNAGISVGYFVADNIAIQAGFENKSNRLFVPLNFGAQSNISDRSTKLTTNTIFFNGIYYLPVESKLRPYFGIGGALLQDITYNIFETDFTGSGEIGFRGLIGLDYTITEKLALNLEVNYNSFNEVEVQDGTNTIINLGYNPLTLNFGLIYAIKL